MLIIGIISLTIPSSYTEPEYFDYEKEYPIKSYDKYHKKLPFIQNNKCSNIIINGIDSTGATLQGNMPTGMIGENDEIGTQDQWSENYYDNEFNDIDRNIVTCTNINNNGQVEQAQPQTGSLTVKKEIFGCNIFIITNDNNIIMDCRGLGPDSEQWLSCDNPNDFDHPDFCVVLGQNLDLFDIEVRDAQDNIVQEFTGSQDGTTIPDLVPGTYTVNEIVHEEFAPNELSTSPSTADCTNNQEFVSGGNLFIIPPGTIVYTQICFQFQDEQGNNCSTTTIAAGETKTCIVKNYIVFTTPGF